MKASAGSARIPSPSSKQAVHVHVHLPLPVWPIVSTVGAPVVKIVGDTPSPQDLREPEGGTAVLERAAPRGEMDVALTKVREVVGVAQVGDVVDGVVEIEVVVVVPVHEPAEVVDAGEGQAPPHEIGVL